MQARTHWLMLGASLCVLGLGACSGTSGPSEAQMRDARH